MTLVIEKQFFVGHPSGKLFAKRWLPTDVDNTDLAPILLFHDSLGCVDLWRDFPQTIARATGRVVIAYDRLGFGKSDSFSGLLASDFVFSEASVGFASVCQHFNIKKVVCFGHSVGGGMAVACAAAYPEICNGVITESAQAFVEDRTLEGIRTAKEGFRDINQLQRLSKYHGDKAKWVLNAWTETWLSENFRNFSLNEVLPKVKCPVLAIHGDLDEYGSVLHPQIISERCSAPSTMKIIANSGHVPHREKQAEVINTVVSFLAG
ncbi:alpha/beta fold hydrolase [Halioxenophilus aromaticivorans]|uniref:Alpha/beta hydrolase n=1 Tax=Halioxenophilus aromaticivorans TaxID=1306992 RepID=A0AAV3U7S1_9ALTE